MENTQDMLNDFFGAANACDVNKFTAFFASDAAVSDEHKTHQGHDKIASWLRQVTEDYQCQHTLKSFVEDGHQVVAMAEVRGNFDGSPLLFQYDFTLNDGLIQQLEIKL